MEFVVVRKGGSGSGNFGHEGRPGEVGGSGEGELGNSGSGKPAPGTTTYFHGTAGDVTNKILKNGIKAQSDARTFEEENFYTGARKDSVFVSSDFDMAKYYGENALNSLSGKYNTIAVFKIEIPKGVKLKVDRADDFLRFQAGNEKGKSYYHKGIIKPEWIKSVTLINSDTGKQQIREIGKAKKSQILFGRIWYVPVIIKAVISDEV
jgi:hypothetical protein